MAIAVTSVDVSPRTLTLDVGQRDTITAIVKPDNADNKKVTWSTTNESIAKVSSTYGTVTAVSPGKVNIVCTTEDGKKTMACSVTVNNPAVTGVSISQPATPIYINDHVTLFGTVSPTGASTLNWTSSNTGVAAVSKDPTTLICTVSCNAVGSAKITATAVNDSTKTATSSITVNKIAVTGVTISQSTLALTTGGSVITLTGNALPSNATYRNLGWKIDSGGQYASVDANGKVTPVAAGTAVVRCYSTDDTTKYATCTVTVTGSGTIYPVTGVKFSETTKTIKVGYDAILVPIISPSYATNNKVSWSSSESEPSAVSVSQSGLIKANRITDKTVRITCTTNDGGYKAYCDVTVIPVYATGLIVTPASASVAADGEMTLFAAISPSDVTTKSVTWSFKNKTDSQYVAFKSKNALSAVITGKAKGEEIIVCTTNDGKKSVEHKVTVTSTKVPVEKIELDKYTVDLEKGEQAVISATVSPSNAANMNNVTWRSSNDNVVEFISQKQVRAGEFTATILGKNSAQNPEYITFKVDESDGAVVQSMSTMSIAPTASVPASDSEDDRTTKKTKVNVKTANNKATGITFPYSLITLNQNLSTELTATISPSSVDLSKIKWKSDNTAVADVDQKSITAANVSGGILMTAKVIGNGLGSTKIRCFFDNGIAADKKEASCKVDVPPIVCMTEFTITNPPAIIGVGSKTFLNVKYQPSNATLPIFKWESSAPGVAKVSDYDTQIGLLEGKTASNEPVKITCKAADGSKLTKSFEVKKVERRYISPYGDLIPKFTSMFGYRINGSNEELHTGIDISFSTSIQDDTKLVSIADGHVIANRSGISGQNDGGLYGWQLIVEYNDPDPRIGRFRAVYAHMKYKSHLNPGDIVKQGDLIGYEGKSETPTTNPYGKHLHFSVWKLDDAEDNDLNAYTSSGNHHKLVNPLTFLYGLEMTKASIDASGLFQNINLDGFAWGIALLKKLKNEGSDGNRNAAILAEQRLFLEGHY